MEKLTKGIIPTSLTIKIYFISHFKFFPLFCSANVPQIKTLPEKCQNFIWKTFPNKIFIISENCVGFIEILIRVRYESRKPNPTQNMIFRYKTGDISI